VKLEDPTKKVGLVNRPSVAFTRLNASILVERDVYFHIEKMLVRGINESKDKSKKMEYMQNLRQLYTNYVCFYEEYAPLYKYLHTFAYLVNCMLWSGSLKPLFMIDHYIETIVQVISKDDEIKKKYLTRMFKSIIGLYLCAIIVIPMMTVIIATTNLIINGVTPKELLDNDLQKAMVEEQADPSYAKLSSEEKDNEDVLPENEVNGDGGSTGDNMQGGGAMTIYNENIQYGGAESKEDSIIRQFEYFYDCKRSEFTQNYSIDKETDAFNESYLDIIQNLLGGRLSPIYQITDIKYGLLVVCEILTRAVNCELVDTYQFLEFKETWWGVTKRYTAEKAAYLARKAYRGVSSAYRGVSNATKKVSSFFGKKTRKTSGGSNVAFMVLNKLPRGIHRNAKHIKLRFGRYKTISIEEILAGGYTFTYNNNNNNNNIKFEEGNEDFKKLKISDLLNTIIGLETKVENRIKEYVKFFLDAKELQMAKQKYANKNDDSVSGGKSYNKNNKKGGNVSKKVVSYVSDGTHVVLNKLRGFKDRQYLKLIRSIAETCYYESLERRCYDLGKYGQAEQAEQEINKPNSVRTSVRGYNGYSRQDNMVMLLSTTHKYLMRMPFFICFAFATEVISTVSWGTTGSPHCMMCSHLFITFLMKILSIYPDFWPSLYKHYKSIFKQGIQKYARDLENDRKQTVYELIKDFNISDKFADKLAERSQQRGILSSKSKIVNLTHSRLFNIVKMYGAVKEESMNNDKVKFKKSEYTEKDDLGNLFAIIDIIGSGIKDKDAVDIIHKFTGKEKGDYVLLDKLFDDEPNDKTSTAAYIGKLSQLKIKSPSYIYEIFKKPGTPGGGLFGSVFKTPDKDDIQDIIMRLIAKDEAKEDDAGKIIRAIDLMIRLDTLIGNTKLRKIASRLINKDEANISTEFFNKITKKNIDQILASTFSFGIFREAKSVGEAEEVSNLKYGKMEKWTFERLKKLGFTYTQADKILQTTVTGTGGNVLVEFIKCIKKNNEDINDNKDKNDKCGDPKYEITNKYNKYLLIEVLTNAVRYKTTEKLNDLLREIDRYMSTIAEIDDNLYRKIGNYKGNVEKYMKGLINNIELNELDNVETTPILQRPYIIKQWLENQMQITEENLKKEKKEKDESQKIIKEQQQAAEKKRLEDEKNQAAEKKRLNTNEAHEADKKFNEYKSSIDTINKNAIKSALQKLKPAKYKISRFDYKDDDDIGIKNFLIIGYSDDSNMYDKVCMKEKDNHIRVNNKRLAFVKSIGFHYTIFKDMWFPFFGYITSSIKLIQFGNEKLSELFTSNTKENFFNDTPKIATNQIFTDMCKLYFTCYMELQLSAQFGGGAWNKEFKTLREYILTHKQDGEPITKHLPFIEFNDIPAITLDSMVLVNKLLKEQNAIIDQSLSKLDINGVLPVMTWYSVSERGVISTLTGGTRKKKYHNKKIPKKTVRKLRKRNASKRHTRKR